MRPLNGTEPNICVRYLDTCPSEAKSLNAENTQDNRSCGRSVGGWVWGLVRRVLSAKRKKRYKYVTSYSEGKRPEMNPLICKETRRFRCMKGLKKGKWDSVCAKRSQDGQL